jgi:hypothetical protein
MLVLIALTTLAAGRAYADAPPFNEASATDAYVRSLVPDHLRTASPGGSAVTDAYVRSLVPDHLRTASSGGSAATDAYVRSLVPDGIMVIAVPERVAVPTEGGFDWNEVLVAGLSGLLIGLFLTGTGRFLGTRRRHAAPVS